MTFQKSDELATVTVDMTVDQADELLDALMASRVSELSTDGQAAYQRTPSR